MHVKPGDKVRFLNEAGEGVVMRLDGKMVWVEVDGMEYRYPYQELLVVEGTETRFASREDTPISNAELLEAAKSWSPNLNRARAHCFTARNKKGVPEIDLHAHELLDRERGIHPGELKQLQLEFVEYALRLAEEKRIREFVIIHGVGEGTLKEAIRNYLAGFQHVEYWDAPFRFYGYGATQVQVRQR